MTITLFSINLVLSLSVAVPKYLFLNFAGGKIQLVAVKAEKGGPIIGHQLQSLPEHIPGVETRVAAIYRKNAPITPTGDTVIVEDDEVFFIVDQKNTRKVMSELRHGDKSNKEGHWHNNQKHQPCNNTR